MLTNSLEHPELFREVIKEYVEKDFTMTDVKLRSRVIIGDVPQTSQREVARHRLSHFIAKEISAKVEPVFMGKNNTFRDESTFGCDLYVMTADELSNTVAELMERMIGVIPFEYQQNQ